MPTWITQKEQHEFWRLVKKWPSRCALLSGRFGSVSPLGKLASGLRAVSKTGDPGSSPGCPAYSCSRTGHRFAAVWEHPAGAAG